MTELNPFSGGLSEPPEGVIAGESVPQESEPEEYERVAVEQMMGLLKTRGEPYTTMSETELEQKAVEQLRRLNE